MKIQSIFSLSLLLGTLPVQADWTAFRGSAGNGFADAPKLTTQLDAEKSLAWKIDLPGRGLSSPVVVGDRIFLTASSGPQQNRLHVIEGRQVLVDEVVAWRQTPQANSKERIVGEVRRAEDRGPIPLDQKSTRAQPVQVPLAALGTPRVHRR